MWIYEQATGKITGCDGHVTAVGYAGREAGKNNPLVQDAKGIGPLPVGHYTLLPPRDSATVGKYAMPLLPDPTNQMFGRNSFYIHGDSAEHPGLASHGCIVMPRNIREAIWASGDRILQVIA